MTNDNHLELFEVEDGLNCFLTFFFAFNFFLQWDSGCGRCSWWPWIGRLWGPYVSSPFLNPFALFNNLTITKCAVRYLYSYKDTHSKFCAPPSKNISSYCVPWWTGIYYGKKNILSTGLLMSVWRWLCWSFAKKDVFKEHGAHVLFLSTQVIRLGGSLNRFF